MNTLVRMSFCPPGVPFFDVPSDPDSDSFPQVTGTVPPDWKRRDAKPWVLMENETGTLPLQGWKVHVSATLESSEKVLKIAYDYLTTQTTWTFKFIRSRAALYRRGAKYGERSASGKFITIYPPDLAALERCLMELGELLDGEPGPYLLSDLRWRRGPLYVRYGGFIERTRELESGELEYVIEAPDGTLVPDIRGVAFKTPEWVELPAVLIPALNARNEGTLGDFPYTVTQALHFSNAGGIYRARHDGSGKEVILREARPHAGEDVEGLDAVRRLLKEESALRLLQGAPGIPELVERRAGYEHTYLVREYVQGRTLASLLTENPLTVGATAGAGAMEDFRRKMLDLLKLIEEGVRGMHERGVVFGDLQPGNIIVRDDGSIMFIDFETATPIAEHRGQTIATPGFVAPAGTLGPAVDLFALGNLKLAVFWPVPTAFGWHAALLERIIGFVQEVFRLPDDFIAGARANLQEALSAPFVQPLLAGNAVVEAPNWPEQVSADDLEPLRHDIAAGLLAMATPERQDRLYPGDPATVIDPDGGLDLRTGAAGVLWALHRAETAVPNEHLDWVEQGIAANRLLRSGLLDGAAGVAWVLNSLGRHEASARLADRLVQISADISDVSYGSGLAGIGLTLARLGTEWQEERYVNAAERIAARIAASPVTPRAAGLIGGSTGPVMLWEELRRMGRDDRRTDAVGRALARDVSLLSELDQPFGLTGTALPDATTRTTLFTALSHGGGTAMITHRFLSEGGPDKDGTLRTFTDAVITRQADSLRIEAGLLQGNAGLLSLRTALALPVVSTDLGKLGLFNLEYGGHAAFLGGGSLRLSADLSTGAAGVLCALSCLTGGEVLPGLSTSAP